MKVLQVPEKVTAEMTVIKDKSVVTGPMDFTFAKWMLLCVDTFPSKGKEAARKADKLAERLESHNGEKELLLEDDHFEIVKTSVEDMDWMTAANRKFVPFYDAIDAAKDEKMATDKDKDKKTEPEKK